MRKSSFIWLVLVIGLVSGVALDRLLGVAWTKVMVHRASKADLPLSDRFEMMRDLVERDYMLVWPRFIAPTMTSSPETRASAVLAISTRPGTWMLPLDMAYMASNDPDLRVRKLTWNIFAWRFTFSSAVCGLRGIANGLPRETDDELLKAKLHFLAGFYGLEYAKLTEKLERDGVAAVSEYLLDIHRNFMSRLDDYPSVVDAQDVDSLWEQEEPLSDNPLKEDD